MFRFYLSTVRTRVWGRQYLNRRFFELLRERFKQRLCFVVARRGGEPIAGTFNVQKGDTLYGRYWGATREVRHLHFNVCYYAARRALHRARDSRASSPAPAATTSRCAASTASRPGACHWLAEPRLRAAVARFLETERERTVGGIDWLREHSALKSD